MIETFFNPQIIEQIWPIVLAGLAGVMGDRGSRATKAAN